MSEVKVQMPKDCGGVTLEGVELSLDAHNCVTVSHAHAQLLVGSHGGRIAPPAPVPKVKLRKGASETKDEAGDAGDETDEGDADAGNPSA